jgi:transcriptional regulator with XRE-family HTH domain
LLVESLVSLGYFCNKKRLKMTQRDMAGFLGVTPMTLRNWRKEKPNLYKIIMQGFAFEEAIESAKENYGKLEALREKVVKK